LSLSFDGTTILSIPLYDTGTEYEGESYWVVGMGNCGGSDNDDGSGQDQGGSGDDDDDDKEEVDQGGSGDDDDDDKEEVDQGGSGGDDTDEDEDQDDNGSGNQDSCLDVAVALTTDSEADEMAMLMYDANDVDTAILVYEYGDLVDNSRYDEEVTCLDTSGCYVVVLFDQGGDGFVSTGGFEVTVNGERILSVGPGDLGTYESEINAMWWGVAFGNCDL
jgi:hypothetical protein